MSSGAPGPSSRQRGSRTTSPSLALEALRAELAQSRALNDAVTVRLRELVHALEAAQPGGGWASDDRRRPRGDDADRLSRG